MTRGILIAGNESALFEALAAEAAGRVERFAAAPLPGRTGGEGLRGPAGGIAPDREIRLPWNPGNPVSARALVMAAEGRLEGIDEAILVCAPPALNAAPAALSPADVEIMINGQLKGWFFLVRELAVLFKARGRGTLALTVPGAPPPGREARYSAPPDLPGQAVIAAFRSLAQTLVAASFEEPYQTLGFTASGPGEEKPCAAFIFKTIEEPGKRNGGKWHKFGKFSLFNR